MCIVNSAAFLVMRVQRINQRNDNCHGIPQISFTSDTQNRIINRDIFEKIMQNYCIFKAINISLGKEWAILNE